MLATSIASSAELRQILKPAVTSRMPSRSNGYSFQVEMNFRSVRHGLKIVELPIHFAERREGESKMNLRVQLESALIPFQLRRRAH